ncbi:hypothetical protein S40293_10211, partial [Stachybotrys chartarum IBT 40293]
FALKALPESDREVDDVETKDSKASGLLPHTKLTAVSAAHAQYYPMITTRDFHVMSNTIRNIKNINSLGLPSELESSCVDLNTFDPNASSGIGDSALIRREINQTKLRRFKESLDALYWVDKELQGSELPVENLLRQEIDEVYTPGGPELVTIWGNDMGPPAQNSVLLPPLPSRPNGRDDILNKLENAFFSHNEDSKIQSIKALIGPKGYDKSFIARTFVHSLQQSEAISVFWAKGRSETMVIGDLADPAGQCPWIYARYSIEEYTPKQLGDFLIRHLTWKFTWRWIMVFEDIPSSTALYLSLNNAVPRGRRGTILFTTSGPNCLSLLGPVKTLPVPYSRGWTVLEAKLKTLVTISYFLTRLEQLSARVLITSDPPSTGTDWPASTTGRPSPWSDLAQHQLIILYVYTTLPLDTIVEVLHDSSRLEKYHLESSSHKKLVTLLDRDPQWLHPRTKEDVHRRIESFLVSPFGRTPIEQFTANHDIHHGIRRVTIIPYVLV